jgi:hypothetical protein
MCACTLMRNSVIIRCDDFESSCVRLYEVSPWISVAPTTAPTRGSSRPALCFPITPSNRYLSEPGATRPARRLISISKRPRARIPPRGLMSAHTSGSNFHVAFLLFLDCAAGSPPSLPERVRSPDPPPIGDGPKVGILGIHVDHGAPANLAGQDRLSKLGDSFEGLHLSHAVEQAHGEIARDAVPDFAAPRVREIH